MIAVLHHIFSRSQRAAYERVVKLLGVRRLTAGFFDVSTGVGGGAGGIQAITDQMRKADGGEIDLGQQEDELGDDVDPAMLDPIQAAMYVSQMYERDQRVESKEEASSESGSGSDDGASGRIGSKKSDKSGGTKSEGSGGGKKKEKKKYPKALYAKVKKFYEKHDP